MMRRSEKRTLIKALLTAAFAFAFAMMLVACTQTSSAEQSSSSEEDVTPPSIVFASQPGVTIERGFDSKTIVYAFTDVDADGEESADAQCRTAFELVDAQGNKLALQTIDSEFTVIPGRPHTIEARFDLSPEELDALSGVRFVCFGISDAGVACISPDSSVHSVDTVKQKYLEAEEERKKQEHIEAWRNRFPTDDYSNTLLIGDSIMQNTSKALRDAMPGVTVDADAGRTLEEGGLVFENASSNKGVLDHVRADDGEYERYVIETGNNDGAGMSESAAEEIVECLGTEKEIYFVTMISTGNRTATENTNDSINAMVEKYPNVHKIDWYGLVAGHESEYLADTCHPRKDRYEDYADFIKEGLDVIY